MYRILIVDDEKIERSGIKFLLKQLGIQCETAEAPNGKAALEYLKEHEVDILLTDVRMPFMDGLELIEHIMEEKKSIQTVIFSGCSEFEYARQAIRLGVSNYILKPVDPKEFERTMTQVIQTLEQSREEQNLRDKSMEYLKEHLLYLLVNGIQGRELEEINRNLLPVSFSKEYRRLMLLEFSGDFFGKKGLDFKGAICAQIPQIGQYLNLNVSQSLLFFCDGSLDFVSIGEQICDFVKRQYSSDCYLAISSDITGTLEQALEETESLMERRFYHPSCRVYYSGMKHDTDSMIQIDDDTLLKQMRQDIKMQDGAGLQEHFDRFCEKYDGKTAFSHIYIKFLFSNLLKDFFLSLPDADEKELNREIEILYKAEHFHAIREQLNRNIERLKETFSQNFQTSHREIDLVKQYISNHCGEELSVDKLADMVYLTPSYLSSLFKKETGQNLSKYIKACRMEKAKNLLEHTMIKIVDISAMCGYPNVSYFCSSFREYYGSSPQRYRETGDDIL